MAASAHTTPASRNDSTIAGPAFTAACWPVSTKMPVPTITPMPNTARSTALSSLRSRCAGSSVSSIDCSTGLVRRIDTYAYCPVTRGVQTSIEECAQPDREARPAEHRPHREQHARHERRPVVRVVPDRQGLPLGTEEHLLVGDQAGGPDRVHPHPLHVRAARPGQFL